MKENFRSQDSYEDVCFIYISKQGEGLREILKNKWSYLKLDKWKIEGM